MSKNLIFCFDGTCNDPEDADQKESLIGGPKDNSITNVLKLHLLFGGTLRDEDERQDGQLSLYYPGVGTYGSKLRRVFNAGLAPENLDVGKIIRMATGDFDRHYNSGDSIFVFGFSRGSAIARRFASILDQEKGGPPIRFLGVFDTVASIGPPNLSKRDRPASDVVFENGHTIAANIQEALHLVSLDDKRKAFQPTLMNAEERVTEVWFPGAHADVGGGYHRDGLSDGALRFMIDELDYRGLGIRHIPPNEIDYEDLLPAGAGYEVEFSDITIEPDVFGKNHQQKRTPLVAWTTLTNRLLTVIQGDEPVDRLPVLHHSVADRMYGDREYRPKSLQGVRHLLLDANHGLTEWTGMQQHLELGVRVLTALKPGESTVVAIKSHKKMNRTGLMLEKDAKYTFQVKGSQTWFDASEECGPEGWSRKDVNWGPKEFTIAALEPFRRVAAAKWFALIGCVGDTDDTAFLIGKKKTKKMEKSGEFCGFANDLDRFYGNNRGEMRLTVTRDA